jgi:hypothetical protein
MSYNENDFEQACKKSMRGGNLWQLEMHREGFMKLVDHWMLITSRFSAILSLIGIVILLIKAVKPQVYQAVPTQEGYLMVKETALLSDVKVNTTTQPKKKSLSEILKRFKANKKK